MASLFRKPRSPFWYLRHKANKEGKWVKVATDYRADDAEENAAAWALRAKYEAKEIEQDSSARVYANDGAWETWVNAFLERHCENPTTLKRYQGHWKWLGPWLQSNGVLAPKQMSYRLALEYIEWRVSYKKRTGKQVGRNTAKGDLKVLALIMASCSRCKFPSSSWDCAIRR